MGNNPAQPNQAGPVNSGAAPNSGGGGVGTKTIPMSKGAPAQSKGKGKTAPPPAPPPPVFGGRTLQPAVPPSRATSPATLIRAAAGNPSAARAAAADERQRQRLKRGTTPKPISTFSSEDKARAGVGLRQRFISPSDIAPVVSDELAKLSLRSSVKSKESDIARERDRMLITTKKAGGVRPPARSVSPYRGRLTDMVVEERNILASRSKRSPPASVPSTPQLYSAEGGLVDVSGGLPSKPHPVSPSIPFSDESNRPEKDSFVSNPLFREGLKDVSAESRDLAEGNIAPTSSSEEKAARKAARKAEKKAAKAAAPPAPEPSPKSRYQLPKTPDIKGMNVRSVGVSQSKRDRKASISAQLFSTGFLPDEVFSQDTKRHGDRKQLRKGAKNRRLILEHMRKEGRSQDEIDTIIQRWDEFRTVHGAEDDEYKASLANVAEEDTLPDPPIGPQTPPINPDEE